MAYEFKLPALGEGVREGEVARWLVEVGQEIAEDDPLVEIQTDKTTVEIPSPAAGKVARILVEAGEVIPGGPPRRGGRAHPGGHAARRDRRRRRSSLAGADAGASHPRRAEDRCRARSRPC